MKNKIKRVNKNVLVVALLCLTFIECIALSNGINGTLMTIIVGAITGIAGLAIPVKVT